jgi:hypothetical protein
MNENLSGFPDVSIPLSYTMTDIDGRISFLYTLKDIDVKIPLPGKFRQRIGLASLSKRNICPSEHRHLFAVVFLIYLLTFCYEIPMLSIHFHKDGVVHRSDLERQNTGSQGKTCGNSFFIVPNDAFYHALSLNLRTYKLIEASDWENVCILHNYSSEHRGRDDLLRL